jgi:hypothetical protein
MATARRSHIVHEPARSIPVIGFNLCRIQTVLPGHYMHEFNGALLNKIPLLKKLQLREVAGGGFLIAPERSLRYVEGFAGIERVFKWPFNPLSKFKLGVYVVGSAANKFNNPVQFKIGITSWDRRTNKWR